LSHTLTAYALAEPQQPAEPKSIDTILSDTNDPVSAIEIVVEAPGDQPTGTGLAEPSGGEDSNFDTDNEVGASAIAIIVENPQAVAPQHEARPGPVESNEKKAEVNRRTKRGTADMLSSPEQNPLWLGYLAKTRNQNRWNGGRERAQRTGRF
jgi:hypothetical protein